MLYSRQKDRASIHPTNFIQRITTITFHYNAIFRINSFFFDDLLQREHSIQHFFDVKLHSIFYTWHCISHSIRTSTCAKLKNLLRYKAILIAVYLLYKLVSLFASTKDQESKKGKNVWYKVVQAIFRQTVNCVIRQINSFTLTFCLLIR